MSKWPPPDTLSPSQAMSGSILDLHEGCLSTLKLPLLGQSKDEDETIRRSDEIMCLNLGGKRHWVMTRNFVNFPGTRLGKLARAQGEEEILKHCDKFWKGDKFNEYFFDVSWVGFNSILDVYRNGALHLNQGICALVTKNDLEYWGIDELLFESCCALKFYSELEVCAKEVTGEEESKRKHHLRKLAEDFGSTRIGRIRKIMWNLTEYPESSWAARVAALVDIAIIIISTSCFIIGTFYELQENENGEIQQRDFANNLLLGNVTANMTEEATQEEDDTDTIRTALRIIDLVTISYFFIEYVTRFVCSPAKKKFFFKAMNFIDFMCILPYIISALLESLQDIYVLGKAGKIMRLIRMMRVMRIFKLVRHFDGLQSLLYTLKLAYKELGLLIGLIGVAVLTFSSLVFYAEKDSVLQWTFLDSFWWSLMTLTTVGYGSQTPKSLMGKAIGCFCALAGVFILTLPVPIIVNSFASYYKSRFCRNKVTHMRRSLEDEQAKIVKEVLLTMHEAKQRRQSYR